jgi:hypothetical protein
MSGWGKNDRGNGLGKKRGKGVGHAPGDLPPQPPVQDHRVEAVRLVGQHGLGRLRVLDDPGAAAQPGQDIGQGMGEMPVSRGHEKAPTGERGGRRPGAARAGASFSRTMVTKKSLPRPSSLSARTSPPMSRAMSLAMARPRPVPPCLRLTEPSTWVKALNTLSIISEECPGRYRTRA